MRGCLNMVFLLSVMVFLFSCKEGKTAYQPKKEKYVGFTQIKEEISKLHIPEGFFEKAEERRGERENWRK